MAHPQQQKSTSKSIQDGFSWGAVAAAVVAGIILTSILKLWDTAQLLPVGLRVGIIGVISLAAACCFPKFQKNMGKHLRWFKGLRVTTHNKRQLIWREGHDTRGAEIERQRQSARQPQWRVQSDRRTEGDFILYNEGFDAWNVSLDSSRVQFAFNESIPHQWSAFLNEGVGSTGKTFSGHVVGNPGEVEFDVSWIDKLGDEHSKSVFFVPPRSELTAIEG